METKTIELGKNLNLEMIFIPGGTFTMGSHEHDPERFSNEIPPHRVKVGDFWMGRYPITQTQWLVVANLPQVERKLDPDPFQYKGDNRPVERVSWYEAIEFCARLSAHTDQIYTLPSEAQWEYACRANTVTAFYFGETITTDLANYDGTYTYYGDEILGIYRNETTDVASFPSNDFGLYDMHGNVSEWCLDHWHYGYNDAPIDGSAWVTGGNGSYRRLRGGSWDNYAWDCRCAARSYENPNNRKPFIGFRVVGVI